MPVLKFKSESPSENTNTPVSYQMTIVIQSV